MHCRAHRNLPPDVEPPEPDHPPWPSTYQPRPRLKWWWWIIVGLICGIAFAMLFLAAPVRAHDHNRPGLEMWFRQQFSGHGPCCDGTDAKHVSDVEWDTTCKDDKCRYRVMAYGRWWEVPEQAVVYGPNLNGTALLWSVPTYDNDKVISVFIRCFMPGAGG